MASKKIFITYQHNWKSAVGKLSNVLKLHGHKVYTDAELIPGEKWEDELITAIRECDIYIYALTTGSIFSEMCLVEHQKAKEFDKPVFVVLLEDNLSVPQHLLNLKLYNLVNGFDSPDMTILLCDIEDLVSPPIDRPMRSPKNSDASFTENIGRFVSNFWVSKEFELYDNEWVIDTFIAKYVNAFVTGPDGRLTVTNRRILFEKKKFAILPGKPIEIKISDIKDAKIAIVGFSVNLRCYSGSKYTFTLYSPHKFIEALNGQRTTPKYE